MAAEASRHVGVAGRVGDGGAVQPALVCSTIPSEAGATRAGRRVDVDTRIVGDDRAVDVAELGTGVPVGVVVAIALGSISVAPVRVDHSRTVDLALGQR